MSDDKKLMEQDAERAPEPWASGMRLLAKLLAPDASGFQRVRFKGAEYILVGHALTTPERYEAGEVSFAHVYEDGRILRFGEEIGTAADLEKLP